MSLDFKQYLDNGGFDNPLNVADMSGRPKTRFEELLLSQEQTQASSPFLQNVAPNLVERGGSRFASVELNPRRYAVSARAFRNPRVRSQEGAFERTGAVQQGTPTGFGAAPTMRPFVRGAVAREAGGFPGSPAGAESMGFGEADIGPANTAIGNTLGNTLATQMAAQSVAPMLNVVSMGSQLGLSAGDIAGHAAGAGVQGALFGGPVTSGLTQVGLSPTVAGPIGLANTLAGAVAAGEIAEGVMGPVEGELQGSPMEMFTPDIAKSTAKAAFNPLGLLGIGLQEAGGRLGFGLTAGEEAAGAAQQAVTDAQMVAQFADLEPDPMDAVIAEMNAPPSGPIGSPSVQGQALGIAGGLGSAPAGPADLGIATMSGAVPGVQMGQVHGLVQQGGGLAQGFNPSQGTQMGSPTQGVTPQAPTGHAGAVGAAPGHGASALGGVSASGEADVAGLAAAEAGIGSNGGIVGSAVGGLGGQTGATGRGDSVGGGAGVK